MNISMKHKSKLTLYLEPLPDMLDRLARRGLCDQQAETTDQVASVRQQYPYEVVLL